MRTPMMDFNLAWRAWKTRYRDQVFELRAIREALRHGGLALDVGANKGSYLYSMAAWAGSSAVVAFEPQRRLAVYLTDACRRCGLSNVTIENLALSNQHSYTPGTNLAAWMYRVMRNRFISLLRRRKPHGVAPFVYTGVQILSKRLFDIEMPDGPFSTNILWDRAITAGRCFGTVHQGLWFEIGRPENIAAAEALMDDG